MGTTAEASFWGRVRGFIARIYIQPTLCWRLWLWLFLPEDCPRREGSPSITCRPLDGLFVFFFFYILMYSSALGRQNSRNGSFQPLSMLAIFVSYIGGIFLTSTPRPPCPSPTCSRPPPSGYHSAPAAPSPYPPASSPLACRRSANRPGCGWPCPPTATAQCIP